MQDLTKEEKPILFQDMSLSPDTKRAIADMGFEEATPIQSLAIDVILGGRDVLGQSQTGTGKTAAFGIPIIERIDPRSRDLQAVILSPTRELAIQIGEEFRKLLKYKPGVRALPVYGGQPIDRQITALRGGVQIVVGTPGRVLDHLERRTIRMDNVRMAVLDEADEMLDMGFRDDIESILNRMPAERQTIMFSATMPAEILELTKTYQTNPCEIHVAHKELTVPLVEQSYFEVKERTKTEALCRLVDMYNPHLSLVFCNTKKRVDELVEQLQGRGYFAEGLHGDLKQQQRDFVMRKFRNGTLEILVATDVAARGLDVDDIDIVFNYDLPQDEEYYIHRIGRTARAGKAGAACTFVVGREIYRLREIMRYTKAKITQKRLPSLDDIELIRAGKFLDSVKAVIGEGHLGKYAAMVEDLLKEDYSALEIAAALVKMNLKDDTSEDIDFEDLDFKEERAEKRRENRDRDYRGRGRGDADMISLLINVGRNKQIGPGDIVGALAGETGIPGKSIGAITIYDDFTLVDVPKELVGDIIERMRNKKMKGNRINIERAKEGKDKKGGKSKR